MCEYLDKNDYSVASCRCTDTLGNPIPNARLFPTLLSICKERVFPHLRLKQTQDLFSNKQPNKNFWFQGSLYFGKTKIFLENPFDERYFLYFEDVDYCKTLWKKGYRIGLNSQLTYTHCFQRKSSQLFSKHFLWHIKSMFQYFFKWTFAK
jgi:GT2 family glycosyltransferase